MTIEHCIIQILREAACRAFVENPRAHDVTIVRFLRASQRYA